MQENLWHPETLLVNLPPDIRVYPEFVTEAEEKDLIKEFESLDWKQIHLNGVIGRRKIIRYGTPTPFFMEPILARAAKLMRVTIDDIAQTVITHYPQGAGMSWHHDTDDFGETVAGVTLQSGCAMKFRHEVGNQYEIFKTEIPDRGAYVIRGESQWDWQHTIGSHKTPRYSITFRTDGSWGGETPLI